MSFQSEATEVAKKSSSSSSSTSVFDFSDDDSEDGDRPPAAETRCLIDANSRCKFSAVSRGSGASAAAQVVPSASSDDTYKFWADDDDATGVAVKQTAAGSAAGRKPIPGGDRDGLKQTPSGASQMPKGSTVHSATTSLGNLKLSCSRCTG